MERREFLLSTAAATSWITIRPGQQDAPRPFRQGEVGSGRIHYELYGRPDGKPLFLGFPVMASYLQIFGAGNGNMLAGYLERLTDRYQVLVVDYPSIGKSGTTPADQLTIDRVAADLLEVADAAGFERFAYWGYLWGAINGLLLASRSRRVSALVCGNWSPLGAPYADMLRGVEINLPHPPRHALVVLREPAQYRQWQTFYRSIQPWDEARAVKSIGCPRMVVIGTNAASDVAGIPLRLAATVHEQRPALERLGWRVTEIPDRDVAVMFDAATIVPIVRAFLDQVTGS